MTACFVDFPGLHITKAELVMTHGVSPSVCVAWAAPIASSFAIGPLTFGENGVPMFSLQDCAIDDVTGLEAALNRGQRVAVRILDRRWKWKGVRIDGRYNVRRPDGLARVATKLSYRDTLAKLLEALGESDYDISLPHDDLEGPTVEWEGARADLELARLIHKVGCLVVLGLDNKIRVVPNGSGAAYPVNGRERWPAIEFFPSSLPYASRTKFAPTIFQSKLKLEAVGLDNTGEVLPIDELSYAPAGGWDSQVPGVYKDVEDDFDREMARETVYKWYRVKEQWNGEIALPGTADSGSSQQEEIMAIEDILPLLPTLVMPQSRTDTNPEEYENWPPDRPVVEGYFYNNDLTGYEERMGDYARWDDAFDLDLERGIVKFDQYVYEVNEEGYPVAAELYLEAAYHARASVEYPHWYWYYDVPTGYGNSDAGVAQVPREDLWKYVVAKYEPKSKNYTGIATNQSLINEIGQQQCESFNRHFTNLPRADMQWAGILPYSCDGGIHQMRWYVDGTSVYTWGSRNSEMCWLGPVHKVRRIYEEVMASGEGIPHQ